MALSGSTLEAESSSVDLLTPSSNNSGSDSPMLNDEIDNEDAEPIVNNAAQKKKKKKKAKKSAKAKEAAKNKHERAEEKPSVLCISRNKHWKYISSYHGPWLQLPIELLDSLLLLNLDPATLSSSEPKTPQPSYSTGSTAMKPSKYRDRGFPAIGDFSPPDSPRSTFSSSLPLPPPFPPPLPGKATPPPVDPGVFRCVASIRRLIDEAAELSVRASSGLSSAELNSMRNGNGLAGLSGSPWAAAQTLGINPLGNSMGTGRNVAMSAMRIHRLRALAVTKLAQAYKLDEIASSVMVMQGGSVFDDLAEKVLKHDPNDSDAKYVHFFHEKIPSRQLAESTATNVLDWLIARHPDRLEYYRTRGIVHCFRDEFSLAIKDFTHALKESRAARKARLAHNNTAQIDSGSKTNGHGKGGKRKKGGSNKVNGQAPPDGTSVIGGSDQQPKIEGPDGKLYLLHPSVLPDAPDPIEPQLLFSRGAAFLQYAIYLIESTALSLEGISKGPTPDGSELRLCYLDGARYGGTEIRNPAGPLGSKSGEKFIAYREALTDKHLREQVTTLIRKSIRDHEKFISHFDSLDSPGVIPEGDLSQQIEYAFVLAESLRPGASSSASSPSTQPPIMPPSDVPAVFTTYHPLLVEAHFSILLCQLLLSDVSSLLPNFIKTATIIDGLEGYPVFLPPRSMSQAEFVEVLERLAGGWSPGVQPHSLSSFGEEDGRKKGRLVLKAPPSPPLSTPGTPTTPFKTEHADEAGGSSSTLPPPSPSTQSPSESYPGITITPRADAQEALDYLRMLLAPVHARQVAKASSEKAEGKGKKGKNGSGGLSINIPLHGPRVEVMLAWLGAVCLPELEYEDEVM